MIDKDECGCIYVMEAPEVERVKIGFSTMSSLAGRFASVNGQSPVPVHLAFVFTVAARDDVRYLERRVHTLLKGKRIRGEWFCATVDEAREAILKAYENRTMQALVRRV